MNLQLKKIKDINSPNCITIILNTHRTHPDNELDAITLKNQIKEAEERLLTHTSKREADSLTSRLNELSASIDHHHNMESLILFVNADIAEYVRLPLAVEDRVIIDNTFATRDLIRAMHLETNYYVLVLNRQKVRLIEAHNNKVVREIGGEFPMENTQVNANNKAQLANANRETSVILEFFNQVDKAVNQVRKNNALPVLICTEESNYYEYLKIADEKASIFDTYLNRVRKDENAITIVEEAWQVVKQYVEDKNNARKAELQQAVSQNKFLSDTNEIYNAIKEGRVQTLFIEQGLFQPAIIQDGLITYVRDGASDHENLIDDIYDEFIEDNMNYGGDVVFLPKGDLAKFNGFGAVTRF